MAQMLMRRFAPCAGMIGMAALTTACATQREERSEAGDEAVATAMQPVFVNGDFEAGTNYDPPPSWTVTSYLLAETGTTYPPQSFNDLHLAAGGAAATYTWVSASGPEQ